MILLDTNVLSELMKPAPELTAVQWLDAQMDSQVFMPAITQANRLTLATRNTKDFEFIPDLLLINPSQMTG